MCLVVVHQPASQQASKVADPIVRYFEGDSVSLKPHPIPTRVFSQFAVPDCPNGPPQLIDSSTAAFSVAILLAYREPQDSLANRCTEFRRAVVGAIALQRDPAPIGSCLPLVIAIDRDARDPVRTDQAFPDQGAIQA